MGMIDLTNGAVPQKDIEDSSKQQDMVVQKSLYLFHVARDLTTVLKLIIEHRVFFLVSSESVLVDKINTAWPSKKNLKWWVSEEIKSEKIEKTDQNMNSTSTTVNSTSNQNNSVTTEESEEEEPQLHA